MKLPICNLFIFIVVTLITPIAVYATEKPNFSGKWELDESKSDNLRKNLFMSLIKHNMAKARIKNSLTGLKGLSAYVEKPSDEMIEAVYQYLDKILPLSIITDIKHDEPLVRLAYSGYQYRDIYTDERDSSVSMQNTSKRSDHKLVFAAWENQNIVIETNTDSGTTIVETFSLKDRGKRKGRLLMHLIQIDSERLPEIEDVTRYYHAQ